ncbi:hypothetical protein [Acidisphaera sp. S103]|uniref:hypothetical protein n=1 Tax=Acidisphaera sp. S103 TaxID=1747223 RepID=UPI00131E0125|nr:hypothetical protein [Acidisphaera sp. S103]
MWAHRPSGRRAKRFDLAPGIIVTANTISTSSFAAQLRAQPLCRVPFEFMWMEWPGADPIYDAYRVGDATAAAPAPHRMVVLIHADESRQKGSMTFAWSHRQEGVNACPLARFFDWRADAPESHDLSRSFFRGSARNENELRQQIVSQSKGMPQVKGSSGRSGRRHLEAKNFSNLTRGNLVAAMALLRGSGRRHAVAGRLPSDRAANPFKGGWLQSECSAALRHNAHQSEQIDPNALRGLTISGPIPVVLKHSKCADPCK